MLPRQTNSRPSWPSSDDTTAFNLIVIAIGIGVGGYLLWTNYHANDQRGGHGADAPGDRAAESLHASLCAR